MRGRKPRPLIIAPTDLPVLRLIAQGNRLPGEQVRRARIVLGIATGQRSTALAQELGCDTSTVWRHCRRYERGGLSGLLANGRKKRPTPRSPCSLVGATRRGGAGRGREQPGSDKTTPI
jgi:hypothetical protein